MKYLLILAMGLIGCTDPLSSQVEDLEAQVDSLEQSLKYDGDGYCEGTIVDSVIIDSVIDYWTYDADTAIYKVYEIPNPWPPYEGQATITRKVTTADSIIMVLDTMIMPLGDYLKVNSTKVYNERFDVYYIIYGENFEAVYRPLKQSRCEYDALKEN